MQSRAHRVAIILTHNRIAFQGNPKLYNTFKDEHLNLALRIIAQASHPVTMEQRIFEGFDALGELGVNNTVFGGISSSAIACSKTLELAP